MTLTQPRSTGELLGEKLREAGLNQTEAAARLSITRQYLNGIINDKYPVTADLLLKLNPLLGTNNEYWITAEKAHSQYTHSPEGRAEILRQKLEDQTLNLDVRGNHTLVNHQLEALIESTYLNLAISPEKAKSRIEATSYQCACGKSGWIERMGSDEKQAVNFSKGIKITRGMMLTLSTQESLPALSRIRIHLIGLTEPWASKFYQVFHSGIIEPGMAGPISFAILNHGPHEFMLQEGDPILRISFEYLAQEPEKATE
jgi:plasmid maintenance system antidote protein VapI